MKIPPTDAAIFSAQTLAFTELNQESALALLGRTLPDGGGNTFYNLAAFDTDRQRAWIQIDAATLHADDPGDSPAFHVDTTGVQVGGDISVWSGGRIGAALGYDKSWLHDEVGGSGTEGLFRASLYGSQNAGPIGLSAVLSWAHAWNDTDRNTGAGGAVSSWKTDEFTGAVQAAAPFSFGSTAVTPAAGVLVTHLGSSSFAENDPVEDGAFAVTGQGLAQTFVTPYVQLGLSKAFTSGSGVTWTPDAEVGYRYDDAAQGGAFALTASDGTVFAGNRVGLDRGSALLGASLSAHKDGWTLYFKYRAQVAGDWTDQSLAAGLRIAF